VRIRASAPIDPARAPELAFPVLLAPKDDAAVDLAVGLADVPAGMAYVPAGPFLLGSRDGADRERPLRWVELPAYFIGRTEVTVAEYDAFTRRTGYRTLAEREGFGYRQLPDAGWEKVTGLSFRSVRAGVPVADPARLPATQLAREDVEAYLADTGLRLPTEAEWEKAARGIDGRRAPWGQEPVDLDGAYRANINTSPPDADRFPWLAPVDAFPSGASPYGVLGMVGTPFEWCADRYFRDAYSRPDPAVPVTERIEVAGEPSDRFVGRGGASGLGGSAEARATSRRRLEAVDRGDDLGFRVARSAP
jgi:formylglycine-generating enzyme required for sulfatase activity